MKATITLFLGLIFTNSIFAKIHTHSNVFFSSQSFSNSGLVSNASTQDYSIGSLGIGKNSSSSGTYIFPSVSAFNLSKENTFVQVGFFLSLDTVLNENDRLLLSESKYIVAEGHTLFDRYVFLDSNIAQGKYYLLAAVDPYNNVSESNESNNVSFVEYEIQPKRIDLTIAFFESPDTIKTGEKARLTTIFTNHGNSYLSFPTVSYYLSTDSIFNSTDRLLTKDSANLFADYPTHLYTFITIPPNIALGNYYILAIGDLNNKVKESDETNNTTCAAITVTHPGVDLSGIYSSSVPLVLKQGEEFSLEINEVNKGSISSSPFEIHYILSKDSTIDPSDILLKVQNQSGLPSNSSRITNTSLKIPFALSFGEYVLIASIDHTSIVNESDEGNNLAFLEINLKAFYDLETTIYSTSKSSFPGTSITLEASVYNWGIDIPEHYASYFLSKDVILDSTDVFLAEELVTPITYGNSTWIKKTVTIPATTSVGNYYVLLAADSKNYFSETNENNNIGTFTLVVDTSDVDLTITTSNEPIYIKPGRSLTTTFTETNLGTKQAGSHFIRFYLSSDSITPYPQEIIESATIPHLAGDSSITIDLDHTVFPWEKPGTYYLMAMTDRNEEVPETNEKNNFSNIRKVIFTPLHVDLTPSLFWDSTSAIYPGSTINPIIFGINNGDDLATWNEFGFYFSKDNILDSTDTFLREQTVQGIDPHGYTYFNANLTIPDSTSYGTYYIIIVADNRNSLQEYNETNNIITQKVTITQPFNDLTTSFFITSTEPLNPGAIVGISGSATSNGSINPSKHLIGYYLSNDSILDNNDVMLSTVEVDSIPFGTVSVSPWFTIPVNVSPGIYYLIAKTDYTNLIAESNEENNIFIANINVAFGIKGPDLTITNLVSSNTNPYPGTIFTLSVKESNIGDVRVKDHHLGYFLSVDPYLDESDIYLSSNYVPSLNASESFGLNPVVAIPLNTAEGYYYILSVADYGNAINDEFNEGNNIGTIVIKVGNPTYDVDLTTKLLSSPASAEAGTTVPIQIQEINQKASTAGFHQVGYYLSLDSQVSSDDYYLGSEALTSLSGFETYNSIFYLNIPITASEGLYYVLVVADLNGVINELDENNNVSGSKITITNTIAGIEEKDKVQVVNLYPNPTSGIIYYNSLEDIDEIEMTNAAGSTFIFPRQTLSSRSQLDLGTFEAGVYALKTKKEGRITSTHKVVVIK